MDGPPANKQCKKPGSTFQKDPCDLKHTHLGNARGMDGGLPLAGLDKNLTVQAKQKK